MTEIWNETSVYIEEIKMRETLTRAFDRMLAGMLESINEAVGEEAAKQMVSVYTKAYNNSLPKLIEKSALMYQELFTKAEINELILIQKNPIFCKLRDAQPSLEDSFTEYTNELLRNEIAVIEKAEHQERVEADDKKRQAELAKETEV